MSRQRGTTLLELITYLSLAGTALFTGYSLYGAERLAHGRQAKAFAESKSVTNALHMMTEDLRRATRAVPRENGPGVVLLLPEGRAIVWFDRKGRTHEIWRKVVRGDGTADSPRVFRGIDDLSVKEEGALLVATARAGREERSVTIRRRFP